MTLTQVALANTVVTLSSSNVPITVPASVTVLANNQSAIFAVATLAVGAQTVAQVTAALNGTISGSLTVNPSSVLSVSKLTLNPSNLTAGSNSTGTITLTGPAPVGGTSVTLMSTNTSAATVPASQTVANGATRDLFGHYAECNQLRDGDD